MTRNNNDNNDSDDGPDGAAAAAAAAACETTENRKGVFEFPENAVDIIGLVLDPDIRAARARVHRKIERGGISINGANQQSGRVGGRALTQGAQTVAKAVVSVHAIQKQAQRHRRQQRQRR
jgi:hypothetical protein